MSMRVDFILAGLFCCVAASGGWVRANAQPEDIPMYTFWGHGELSKKDAKRGAIGFLFLGVVLVIAGLAF